MMRASRHRVRALLGRFTGLLPGYSQEKRDCSAWYRFHRDPPTLLLANRAVQPSKTFHFPERPDGWRDGHREQCGRRLRVEVRAAERHPCEVGGADAFFGIRQGAGRLHESTPLRLESAAHRAILDHVEALRSSLGEAGFQALETSIQEWYINLAMGPATGANTALPAPLPRSKK